ncbi:UBX domain-containing protein 11 isoform X1 [Alosa sapidissima]|uniref:UBX domain-containing protein 11 isoform X1 n=1 Tax=Alosa sapidissima TaxID=34773 RepID=UPI001C08285F|nr:UBX domain-containing protein 11 isoform X1 [Alosa sapidissima]
MSSPLSLLGKTRRAPLPGSLDEGRKRVPLKQSSSIENELGVLKDILSRRCHSNRSNADGATSSKMSQRGRAADYPPPTDFELMSTMMQKLAQLEIKVKAQALDIQRKEKTIAVLEEKLKFQKKSKEQNCEEELVEKCHNLQKQVWEMEQFLADYGMIWIGNNCDRRADEPSSDMDDADKHTKQSLWEPATSRAGEFRMNFDLVLANIRELNVLAGEGESYVKAVPGGAQLAQRTPIPLQLYSNGIVMFSGPFRSYDEPSTQQCMQDLMDGYFPSELQERFPDGVPFQVQDRREEVYKDRREQKDFPGKGQLVCEASSETSAQSLDTTQGTSCASGKAVSTEQFLRKLPKTVIKAGKVIDIRDSLRNHLKGSAVEEQHPSVIIVDTPALQTLHERLDEPDRTTCDPDGDISTLRVKSENGEKTFVLKMHVTQTVGDLRQYLDKHRCSGSSPYNIISVFPRRRYDDDTQTLAACGLTPSAALLLQPY